MNHNVDSKYSYLEKSQVTNDMVLSCIIENHVSMRKTDSGKTSDMRPGVTCYDLAKFFENVSENDLQERLEGLEKDEKIYQTHLCGRPFYLLVDAKK